MTPLHMRIETGCRLHLGLIDLNGEIGRIDGGVGLALTDPGVSLTANESTNLVVSGPMADRVKEAASATLDHFGGKSAQIHIESTIPQHVGLGSGTQVALATGAAIAKLNDISVSTNKLAKIVGRGGTSGIGTAAFDSGGFILDGGHDMANKKDFLPSAVAEVQPPPIISRLDFPDWNIQVFLPDGKGAHSSDEISIFKQECPIPLNEVQELSHIVTMKLLPAVAERNFKRFKESIESMQKIGFKKREIDRQPKSKNIIDTLSKKGYAAGMSSLGPAVFAVSPTRIDCPSIQCETFSTSPDHNGAHVLES